MTTYLDVVKGTLGDAVKGAHYWDLLSKDDGARDRLGSLNGQLLGANVGSGFTFAGGKMLFSGTEYLEVPDHADLSIPTTGALSVAFWAGCSWKGVGGNGEYVNFWGKGQGSGASGQQEYCGRYYIKGSTKGEAPQRVGRMSGYAFNLAGDKGSGSYHEDGSCPTRERFFVVTYTMKEIRVYCDGVMQHAPVPMSQYSVVPRNGTAPFRFGTRDKSGYFVGTGRRLLVAGTALTAQQVKALFGAAALPDSEAVPVPPDPVQPSNPYLAKDAGDLLRAHNLLAEDYWKSVKP